MFCILMIFFRQKKILNIVSQTVNEKKEFDGSTKIERTLFLSVFQISRQIRIYYFRKSQRYFLLLRIQPCVIGIIPLMKVNAADDVDDEERAR